MSATLVLGAQWGDEGKGKIIDFLSKTADYSIRFHGGNNAGHTVINNYGKFAMHLLPSGVFQKNAIAVITNGVVLDLEVLLQEIETLEKAHISLKNRLLISPRCHVILPYHKLLDAAYENAKGKGKTGTTGRGIGPVHADKVSYNGVRLFDFFDKNHLAEKIATQLQIKNKILQAFGQKPLSAKKIVDQQYLLFKKIEQYIVEPFPILQKALVDKKNLLLEGAQAVFLDNDWGTYPFVTASTILSGGINHQAGILPKHLTNIIGVSKAYATRVGAGPFPSELVGNESERLRTAGNEFGTTTGRPRRCGWLDTELLQFAKQITGLTELVITKLDVLDNFDEIKICTGYTYKGKTVHYFDGDAVFLEKVTPVYKTFQGWKSSTQSITKYANLPKNAKIYLQAIEKLSGIKISYVCNGAKREDIIKLPS